MNDLNAQSKPGGSSRGRKHEKIEELTPEQQKHENEKRKRIEAHQHKDDIDDDINYTD